MSRASHNQTREAHPRDRDGLQAHPSGGVQSPASVSAPESVPAQRNDTDPPNCECGIERQIERAAQRLAASNRWLMAREAAERARLFKSHFLRLVRKCQGPAHVVQVA
jgi:hypothetical protein